MAACLEAALCNPTASVTMVTVYKVPGRNLSSRNEVEVFCREMFLSRILS